MNTALDMSATAPSRLALTQWMTVTQTATYLHLSRQRVSQLMQRTPPLFERAQIGELTVLSRASVYAFAERRLRGEL